MQEQKTLLVVLLLQDHLTEGLVVLIMLRGIIGILVMKEQPTSIGLTTLLISMITLAILVLQHYMVLLMLIQPLVK